MLYRNKKTGATIDVAFAIGGKNWEPVTPVNKKAEPVEEPEKVEETEGPKEEAKPTKKEKGTKRK